MRSSAGTLACWIKLHRQQEGISNASHERAADAAYSKLSGLDFLFEEFEKWRAPTAYLAGWRVSVRVLSDSHRVVKSSRRRSGGQSAQEEPRTS